MPSWNYNSSTCENQDFLMSNFTPTAQNIEGEVLIDLFNYNFQKAITAIQIQTTLTYKEGQRLPVIAYKQAGNTSCYWIIGAASGVLHPYRMQGGDNVLIPNMNLISSSNILQGTSTTQSTTQAVTI